MHIISSYNDTMLNTYHLGKTEDLRETNINPINYPYLCKVHLTVISSLWLVRDTIPHYGMQWCPLILANPTSKPPPILPHCESRAQSKGQLLVTRWNRYKILLLINCEAVWSCTTAAVRLLSAPPLPLRGSLSPGTCYQPRVTMARDYMCHQARPVQSSVWQQ